MEGRIERIRMTRSRKAQPEKPSQKSPARKAQPEKQIPADAGRLLLAMPNSGSHTSFLTTNLSTTSTGFLYTHEHTLLINCKKHAVSATQ
jgi:hypothetical protein